jgi:hypothetical protein
LKDAPAVEAKMVKKFRRAAAGIEEQLPSDLRTPQVLSQTCDYLFNEIVANAPELGRVHHFVWDRTRAIRNDFTILQVSNSEDLSYAVDCLERIARFHILSLHQMAGVKEKDFQYDWQQDREQLDRTLVSLMQYYDDSRGKVALPNEPEFRAYLIVFQLQDPDMEDRVQSWPQELVQHPRIRKAMELYAAAGDTSSLQGPLRPPATLPIAQQNWQRFWNLVASKRTSYLTACVAEINFNLIRRVTLQALTRSVNQRATADFTPDELCSMLEFNDDQEAEGYLACYNVTFVDREEGRFADISALKSRQVLPEPSPAPPKQLKSDMVEGKRFGRSLPAVISGYTLKEAQVNGMVDENEMGFQDEDMGDGEVLGHYNNDHGSDEIVNDGESLFMPDIAKPKSNGSPFGVDFDTPPTSVFGQPTQQTKTDTSSFGKPSPGNFGFASSGGEAAGAPFGTSTAPKSTPFNFLGGSQVAPVAQSTFSSTPSSTSNAFSGFSQPKSETLAPSAPGESLFAAKKDSSGPGFGGFNFTATTNNVTEQARPTTTASPFSQPKQSAPDSLFSQPPKPAGPPMPFIEEVNDSSPTSSPQIDDFPAIPSPTGPPSDKPKLPTFSFAASKAPDTQPAKETSPFSFAKPEESAKQPQAAPSFTPEAPAITSLATSNAKPTPPPKPANTPSNSFSPSTSSTVSARRGSTSENFNRPAKPSPLAQSYTAATDAADTASSAYTAPPQPDSKSASSVTGSQKSHAAQRKQSVPEPDFASIIRDIARSVTLTPDVGLFDQWLEFHLGKVITDVQEVVHFERVNAQADEYRASVLSHKYGKLWRDVCRRRRLARQGRERRKRNQQRLLESRSQASDTASFAGSVSAYSTSQFGNTVGAKLSRQEEVDKMFQQSVSSSRWSRMAKQDEQTKGGSKRPTSSHSIESLLGSRGSPHKRLKSTSHVDDSGRITKPAPTSHPTAGGLKRSSFREALPDNPPIASTTKSNYFRLKAMGRAHVYDLAPTYPRKRQHADVTSSPASGSFRQSIAHSPTERASPPSSKVRRTSSSSVRSRPTAEDTDSIIARARAAREALRDGSGPLHSDAGTPDPHRQSTGSQVLYESPSLERARLDARWRASQNTDFGSSRRSDVPAYRLRESKFVPREQYGKAIDRSREMRQSRAGSRPESRVDNHTPSKPDEVSIDRPEQVDFNGPSPAAESVRPSNTTFGGLSQPHWPTAAPSQFSTGSTPFDTSLQDLGTMQSNTFGATSFEVRPPQPSGFGNYMAQPTQMSAFASDDSHVNHFTPGIQGAFGQSEAVRASPAYQLGFANFPTEQISHGASDVHVTDLVDIDDELHVEDNTVLHVNGTGIEHAVNGHQFEHINEDEDGEQTMGHVNPYAALANGHMGEDDDEEEEEEEAGEDKQHTLGHANSFAALANGEDEEGDEEEEEEEEEEDNYGQYTYGAPQPGVYPGAAPNGEYDDDEEDGDIEDEDGEGFDEDESDLEEDEDDEEETNGDQFLDPRMLSQHQSAPKPNTAADAEVIELSD